MSPHPSTPLLSPRTDRQPTDVDLHHHGDREVAPGLVDLAVNVHPGPRPAWLHEALVTSLAEVGSYPDTAAARSALAARHQRSCAQVLPTSGGAEAFTLIARARRWTHPVVVHPQFTEPEAALRAAGHSVQRVLLRAEDGFTLDPDAVPEEADLVVIGNPTNPTGVLHPARQVLALARPGRVLVVDEAFMDAVPGEPESLAATQVPGLLVLRSLTKTWSIPGVRAGYVLGPAELLADLAVQQPPWSVSSTAAAAMTACSTPQALAEADRRAVAVAADRQVLVQGLAERGLAVSGEPRTPFVLLHGPADLRDGLRERGFAVRRGDTFPGLGSRWVRVAVRDRATTAVLLAAVDDLLAGR